LEHGQAKQAKTKGIDALVINEDTTKTAGLWKHARTSAAMVYMSPEMALAPSFQKLWKDSRFRTHLTAIVVDEARCIVILLPLPQVLFPWSQLVVTTYLATRRIFPALPT
jgi:superfamily II DNA helicase RecQ